MEDKNLGHLRKTYTKGILQISDMGSNPMVFFKKWFES